MENVFVKPALDAIGTPLVVRDPVSGEPLKANGEWKAATSYWMHRIRDVDVINTQPPAKDEPEPSPVPKVPRRNRRKSS